MSTSNTVCKTMQTNLELPAHLIKGNTKETIAMRSLSHSLSHRLSKLIGKSVLGVLSVVLVASTLSAVPNTAHAVEANSLTLAVDTGANTVTFAWTKDGRGTGNFIETHFAIDFGGAYAFQRSSADIGCNSSSLPNDKTCGFSLPLTHSLFQPRGGTTFMVGVQEANSVGNDGTLNTPRPAPSGRRVTLSLTIPRLPAPKPSVSNVTRATSTNGSVINGITPMITVGWTKPNTATAFRIYRGSTNNFTVTPGTTPVTKGGDTTEFECNNDNTCEWTFAGGDGVGIGANYYRVFTGFGAAGSRTFLTASSPVSDVRNVGAHVIANVVATSTGTDGDVTLTWDRSRGTFTRYRIYRSNDDTTVSSGSDDAVGYVDDEF